MTPRSCFIASVLLLATLGGARAADADDARWACWYAPSDLQIRCLLVQAPADADARRSEVARQADSRLPALVHEIWGDPGQLAGTRIRIPLWNVPYDMKFARELAESVMCGVVEKCGVLFDENADGNAPLRAAALAANPAEPEALAGLFAQALAASTFQGEGEATEATEATEGAKAPERKSRRWRFFSS